MIHPPFPSAVPLTAIRLAAMRSVSFGALATGVASATMRDGPVPRSVETARADLEALETR